MYLDDTYNVQIGDNNGVQMAFSYGRTGGQTVGVFMYRAQTGHGSIEWRDISLRWRYNLPNAYLGTNTVLPTDEVTIKVFAIEMVYVPQGAFFLGSGSTMTGEFCRADQFNTISEPFLVSSEAAISVRARVANQAELDARLQGISEGTLQGPGLSAVSNQFAVNVANSIGPVGEGAIPAEFPKGFQAFYIMKYEITQGAYVDFLNTLTVAQQATRTRAAPNSAAGTRVMMQSNASDRNFIKILRSGVAEYGVDMNNNNILNEHADGHNVACAMNSQDLMAYLDFAGLRPMTELEYEKASRGFRDPVPNEFAWGSTYFLGSASGFVAGTAGTPQERPITAGANIFGVAAQANVTRNGAFASENSGRVVSGATYWGVMEMSGNLWEYTINVINPAGRAFTGNHGDGRLTAGGAHDVFGWPDFLGFGLRGGSAGEAPVVGSNHAIPFRGNAWWNSNPGNSWNVGGRGVRTAT
jgi:formylglycine-generating enzyme required for sulfatase activity